MIPDLMIISISTDIQIFGVNYMKAGIHPVLYQWFRLVVVVYVTGGCI